MQVDEGSWSAPAPTIYWAAPKAAPQPHTHHGHREKQATASPAWDRVNTTVLLLFLSFFLFFPSSPGMPILLFSTRFQRFSCRNQRQKEEKKGFQFHPGNIFCNFEGFVKLIWLQTLVSAGGGGNLIFTLCVSICFGADSKFDFYFLFFENV